MNSKSKVSMMAIAVVSFGLLLSYQNCSKKNGSLNLGGTPPPPQGVCTTCSVSSDVTVIVSKAQGGTANYMFNYLTDSLYIRATGGGAAAKGCITVYNDAGCDLSLANQWASFQSNTGWSYDSSTDTWNFLGPYVLNGNPIFVAGKYRSCVYNPTNQKANCGDYVVSAPVSMIASKTNGGASVATFSYAVDNIWMRVSHGGPHLKACIATYIPSRPGANPNDLHVCDTPNSGPWLTMTTGGEWSMDNWTWNFKGWGGNGDHKINHSPYMVSGSYKFCFYNPDVADTTGVNNSFACTSYTIN